VQALGKGGSNMGTAGGIGSVSIAGLLTNDAPSFGAAAATYSSFYADSASNRDVEGAGAPTSTALTVAGGSGEEEGDDGADYDPLAGRTKGLGRVFVEFDTPEAALACQTELSGRAFSGRILCTSFVDESAYDKGQACDFNAC
jgi:hypothetical protein